MGDHVSGALIYKRSISKKCKELIQLSNKDKKKNTQITQLRIGQRTRIEIFPEKTCKWPASI